MKIVVVGAGIIGALTAFRLAEGGAEVTVVEAGQPAGAAAGASFGWINASFYADADHFNLRRAGIEAHRRLTRDLETDAVAWPGCLCWEQEGAAFDAQRAALEAFGYSLREVDRSAFTEMEPAIAAPHRALHFRDEGAVDLARLADQALRASAARGARLITGISITGFDVRHGRLKAVQTQQGALLADGCVIAAGVATQSLVKSVGVDLPMLHRPGLIVESEVLPPVLRHILVSPGQELRQLPNGRVLAPAAASHQGDAREHVAEAPDVLADRTMARVSALLNRSVRWERVTRAARPVPQDGLPVIGPCGPDGFYVTTMHSGATLAPLAAELAAAEVLDRGLSNELSALLAPYRPQRFTA